MRNSETEIESGKYEYTVIATDKAGKATENKITVLIDKEAPRVKIVSPDSSYVGISAIAKDVFTFSGAAEEESYESGVDTYSYALIKAGSEVSENDWIENTTGTNWSFTKTIGNDEGNLSEGSWTLYVKARDKAGNETAEADYAKVSFDVDKGNPVQKISLSPSSENNIYDETFNVEGKIYDTNGVSEVKVSILNAKDNSEVVSWIKKDIVAKEEPQTNNLGVEISVGESGVIKADGNYIIEVTVTDNVGKEVTERKTVTVDRDAPIVEIKSHGEGDVVSGLTKIEGTVTDVASGVDTTSGLYKIYQGEEEKLSGELTIQSSGTWSGTLTEVLPIEGEYTIYVEIKDKVNHKATSAVTVEYDKALPQLIVTEPSGNSVITNGNVVISGKSWDTYGLKENGSVVITLKDANANIVRSFTPEVAKTTSEPTDNNWEETIEVGEGKSIETDGKYTVEIKAVDKVGKESVIKTINVDVDTTKPIVGSSIIVPTSTQTEGTSFKFNGISSDGEGIGVEKVEISFDEETWVEAVGTSVWTYTSIFSEEKTFETDGAKTIYVKATDGAGNESEVRSGMFVFDSSRPEGKIKNEEGVEITGKSFFVGGEFTLNVDAKDKYSVSKIELTQTKDGKDLKTYTQEVEGKEVTTAISRLPLRTDGTEIETGNYEYKVVVTDKVGKTAEITTTIVIDKRAPKVEITSPDSSYVGISAIAKDVFTFAGTAEEESYESGVESYSYVLTQTNGIPTTGWTTTTSGTNWSFTKTIGNDAGKLSEGRWTLYVKARDKAGNETAEADYAKVSFDVDKGNPVANISLNPISETNTYKETFKVEGKLYDTNGVSKVKVSILNAKDNSEVVSWEKDGIEAKSQPTNNNLSEEITIGTNGKITSDGNYIIEVTVTDNVGKEVTERRSITVDRKGPTVEFKSHEDGNIITTFPITVEGTASDEGSGVNTEDGVFKLIQGSTTVESGKLNIQANGIWNGSIVGKNLTEGEYKLQVTIKDKAGYDDTSEVTVKYDKALPQLIVTEPSGNSVITNENVVISGKSWDTYGLKENGSVVITLKDANANIVRSFTPEVAKTTSEPTDNNWEETIEVGEGKSIETDGKYTVEIKAVDKVGKESLSQVYELTIDRVNPKINTSIVDETKVNDSNKGSDGTNTVYNVTQIPIKVLASDGASGLMNVTYSVTPNDNSSYNALVLKNGEWTGYVTCDWQGTQNISVKAEDKAGNSLTKTIPVTIDTIAPDTITSSIEGTRLENGTRNVQVELSATDAGNTEGTEPYNSGVAKVEIVKIGSQKVSISGTWNEANKKWILSIPNGEISTGGVTVKVTDNANNSVENTIFTFQLDNKAPTVSITGLSDADSSTEGTQINGTVTLTGTSNDDQGLAETTPVKLYYSKDGGTTYTSLANVEGTTSWSLDIDTTKDFGSITDGTTITLKAEAVDKAGNTNSTTTTVIVNQDTDRPIINLSNLDYIEGMTFEEMTSSKPVWHKQKYLFGSVTDDDGTIKELFVSTDGTNWGENVYKNGSWSYTFSDDGDKTLYFKVIDANGTDFISNGTTKPKLSDGTTTNSTDSNLYLKVDTTQPTIPVVRFSTSSSPAMDIPEGLTGEDLETWASGNGWQDIDELTVTTLGGPESVLYVMYNAYDANGIYSTKVKCAEKEIEEKITDVLNPATNIVKIVKFDTSDIDDTIANKLVIEARDNATGNATIGAVEKNYSLRVDNTKPTVRFSRIDDMLYGSIATEIEGSTNDANTVEEVFFGVSEDDSTSPTKYLPLHEGKESNISWKVSFSGSTDEATEEKYQTQLLNTYLGTIYNDVYVNGELKDVEKYVYFWVYAVDGNGNVSEPTKKKVLVSTMGDKPRVNVSFPTVNDKTGGSIRITGESEIQASELDSVWIQIDPSYEGTFNEDWKTELDGLISGKEVGYSITEEPKYTNESGTEITIEDLGPAIKAFGNPQSWNLQINTLKEFETTGEDVNICIRVYAVGKTGKVSEPVLVPFIIDPKSPRIGNTTPLQLVQYDASDGTTIKARMNYEPGMWISGRWYLTGSVEDESGISLISFGEESLLGTEKVVEGDSSKREVIEVESTSEYKNYLLKVPVGNNTTNAFGQLNYTLTVIEGASDRKSATQSIILNYDNKAPEFEAELDATENRIYQNNGTYSVSGTFDEAGSGINNQSGFNRIAMYFTRTYDETKYIVDPMIENGDDGDDNRYPETEFTYLKGIYWRKINGNISNGQVPTNSLSNVRVGGLCMINEVIYKIKSIDNAGYATLDKTIGDQENVDIYFALAQVIDNTTVESGTTEAYDSTEQDSHINGDGDQMIEGVHQNGTTYNWTASIDSSLIYDGPITINFVAFDAAGNSVTKTYSGTVTNNAPRIVGVSFGTDDNGDEIIADNEMITNFSGWYKEDSQTGVTENGKNANGENETVIKSGDYDSSKVSHSTDGKIRNVEDLEIKLTVKDFLSKNIQGGQEDYIFSIIDKTLGMTTGQTANIKIPMNVMLNDEEKPTVTIKPFYWDSKDENSLYKNSRENGHIELEDDLDDEDFGDESGQYDKDPKVSGKITIEGEAHDNVSLMELGVKTNTTFGTEKTFGFTGYRAIAERENGTWKSQGTLADNGWEFEVVDETNTQEEGNTLKWKLHLDTQKVENVAQADFILYVQAIDRGSAYLDDDGNLKYAYAATTDNYKPMTAETTRKMDIVPYITDVKTMLWEKKKQNQSVYSRTARGHYPVASNEEITLIGFNLSAEHYSTDDTSDYRTIKKVAASSLTTGEYNEAVVTYTVDDKTVSLAALNNKNSNDAVGSVSATNAKLEDKYNMQPNSETNNKLTDDIFFDVWEINEQAATAKNGVVREPVMHISPIDGKIGFAFVNGPAYFSMPNGNDNSYTIWQKNHADYNGIDFVYDDTGNTHSLSTGLDTQPQDEIGGRLQYIDSRWGGSGENVYNWNTSRTVALDSICIKDGTFVNGTELEETVIDMKRFSSPSIAVGANNSVYIAYFDRFNNQIRFVSGVTSETRNSVAGHFVSTETDSGSITTDTGSGGTSYNDHDGFESATSRYSIIAGDEYDKNGENKQSTGNKAGKYLDLAVIPGTTTTGRDGDVVVIVWYDDEKLHYTYRQGAKTTVTKNNNNTTTVTNDYDANVEGVKDSSGDVIWSKPIQVFADGVGENCKITVDKNGGIHIAAYDRNGADLYYAYLSDKDATPKTCVVDSYSQVGKNISIDVAKMSSDGKVIPYISYFANGFSNLPKVAYLPDGIDSNTSLPNGSDINTDLFTGNWEVSLIPTSSYVCEDNINVAVWKDKTTGVIKKSTTGTFSKGDTGTCYGNGTSQFVLGYATEEGVNGYIETAQLKNPQPATN